MPIYSYECEDCGRKTDHFFAIDEKPDSVQCSECSGEAKSIITVSSARVEWGAYWDDNLGDVPILVEGRSHRKKLMKERGLIDQYKSNWY